MRLIHAQTLELKEYLDDKAHSYAILSHRWGESEMNLRDMQSLQLGQPANPNSEGFIKIKSACEQAVRDGHKYIWVDT